MLSPSKFKKTHNLCIKQIKQNYKLKNTENQTQSAQIITKTKLTNKNGTKSLG